MPPSETAMSAAPAGRWVALGVLLIAGFMNLIDVTIVNVALPSIQENLGASTSQIEWVVAAYILVFALGLLPCGRLGDIFGRRRMFLGGVFVFTSASALCGMAPSIEALIGARVLQAVGGSMMAPQTLAFVPALFSVEERGAAFALFGLSAGFATVTGPLLGGWLIGQDIAGLDWRPIFLINVPVGLLALVLAYRVVPRMTGKSRLGNDYVGIALGAGALFLVVFPLIEGRQLDWPLWSFAMLGGALPAAGLFLAWERQQAARGAPQLLPVELLADRSFRVGTLMTAMLFSGIPGFFLVLALYLQQGFGLTPFESGLTTLPFSVGTLTGSIAAGFMGPHWMRRRIAAGTFLLACGMVWLRFTIWATEVAVVRSDFIMPLAISGLGLGTAISPLFQTVLANIRSGDTGSASGALQAFQQVGGALGVAIMGQMFFSRLTDLAGDDTHAAIAGDGTHAAFAGAMTHALDYNTLAFLAIALLVWRLSRPTLDR